MVFSVLTHALAQRHFCSRYNPSRYIQSVEAKRRTISERAADGRSPDLRISAQCPRGQGESEVEPAKGYAAFNSASKGPSIGRVNRRRDRALAEVQRDSRQGLSQFIDDSDSAFRGSPLFRRRSFARLAGTQIGTPTAGLGRCPVSRFAAGMVFNTRAATATTRRVATAGCPLNRIGLYLYIAVESARRGTTARSRCQRLQRDQRSHQPNQGFRCEVAHTIHQQSATHCLPCARHRHSAPLIGSRDARLERKRPLLPCLLRRVDIM